MATLTHDDAHRSALRPQSATLSGLVTSFQAWLERRSEIARVELELRTYNDRNLADLGLSREDIPAVARGEFRRA